MAAGGGLQKVHAPDGGGLAGAGGADDDQLLALFDFQIYVLQNVKVTEIFLNVFQFNHHFHPQIPEIIEKRRFPPRNRVEKRLCFSIL